MLGRTQEVLRACDAVRRVARKRFGVGLGRSVQFTGGRDAGEDAPGQRIAGGEGVVAQQEVQRAPGT
ncbi:hypothetical protein G6F57_022958 [Rhizopus arrhizus]|nr:hypothetical protein G6F57_022958 [Rhizopus arrhizus]